MSFHAFMGHPEREYLYIWGPTQSLPLALSLQYTVIFYILVLVLTYPTIKLSGLAEIPLSMSFDVKNFIQQYDDNGPTLDAVFIINTMVPGFAIIAHPLCTLFKLNVSIWW